MRVTDYDYDLPPELIAKTPLAERDGCRLLWISAQRTAHSAQRGGGGGGDGGINGIDGYRFEHLPFRSIIDILKPGDRLVFNDTRVIPARLFCRKEGTGAAVELFFTERVGEDGSAWKVLVKPAKKAPAGTILLVDGDPRIRICVDEVLGDGYERLVSLVKTAHSESQRQEDVDFDVRCALSLDAVINAHGRLPLPHYMEREGEEVDSVMYQTVFAAAPGAVAAPTAGLHFTQGLLDELAARGVDKSFVTLHVGIGTFRPVQVDDPRDHEMHEERFELSPQAADEINATWARGGRVIAVGTTVVRVLESCAESEHMVAHKSARTKLLILPPHTFRVVDGLITNFHLPKSTLLMLVSAFASRETVLAAYREAIDKGYRFYSYGDAMAII